MTTVLHSNAYISLLNVIQIKAKRVSTEEVMVSMKIENKGIAHNK